MDRRRTKASARGNKAPRARSAFGMMLLWLVISLLLARAQAADPSDGAAANEAQIEKPKCAPVYDNYDPEKNLANRPATSAMHQEAEPPGVLFYLLAASVFAGAVLGCRRLLHYLSGTEPWNATKRAVQELLPGLIEHT